MIRTQPSNAITGVIACVIAMTLTACLPDAEFMRQAQGSFADGAFNTAIGLIELHKLRTGTYPESLDRAVFASEFDKTSFRWVKYEKVSDGYALDVVAPEGVDEAPELSYPADFFRGLGLVRTNVRGKP